MNWMLVIGVSTAFGLAASSFYGVWKDGPRFRLLMAARGLVFLSVGLFLLFW